LNGESPQPSQDDRASTVRTVRPTLSVNLPTFGDALDRDWRRLVELAVAADEAGVDRVVVPEHVVLGEHTDAYPWGTFASAPDAPWLDPLVALSAIAGVTTRVRLATGILIAPMRPAVVLAKSVATLDVLSAGRVDLGIGTGWQREELEAAGASFESRGQVLTDTVAACRALWTQLPASFESPSISFADIYCAPHPVQRPLPVWFAGSLHGRNLRRIVDLGDGWIPIMGSSSADVAAGVEQLRRAFAASGRDVAALQVRAAASVVRNDGLADLAATMAAVPSLVAAGATDIGVNLRALAPDLGDPAAAFERIVEAFRTAASA
jgi:probable F420-dependent oxidoreductase